MTSNSNPKSIRREMALTRLKINDTINEIGDQVAPVSMETVAKSGLKHARHFVESEAQLKLSGATSKLEEMGSSTAGFIRRHPLVTSLVGLALGLLLARRSERPQLPTKVAPLPSNTKEMEILI